MENVIFKSNSSFDKANQQKMLIVFLLMIVVLTGVLFFSVKYDPKLFIVFSCVLVLNVVLFSFWFLNTSVKYYLTQSMIYIKRPLKLLRINIKDVKKISEFNLEDRKGLYRVISSEGLFGNFGIYSSKLHKRFNLFASSSSNWVLIEMKFGKKYVISPDNLKFVEKANEVLALKDNFLII